MTGKTIFLIFLSLLSCGPKYGSIKEYAEENIFAINSVSPADTDFRDLEIIGSSIGNSKIVLLGEQDHGDAPAFLAKTRLIKYLHENQGFNIIAFESDFYGLHRLNEKSLKPSKASIEENIYRIWSDCQEVSGLFDYYEKRDKLRIYGFDCRMSAPYSKKNFLREFKSLNILPQDSIRFYRLLEEVLEREYDHSPPAEDQQYFFRVLEEAQSRYPEEDFNAQAMRNLREFANNAWNDKNAKNSIRDIQMAQNLAWLHKNFPDEKIIVWAHNFHISKNAQLTNSISKDILYGVETTMGAELSGYINEEDFYVLGFTSLQGSYGRILSEEKYTTGMAAPDGLERQISSNGIEYGFIDFRNLKDEKLMMEQFELKGYFHTPSSRLPWAKIFDGLFYIQDMYPCGEKE